MPTNIKSFKSLLKIRFPVPISMRKLSENLNKIPDLEGINSKIDQIEEKICEFKDRLFENIWTVEGKGKKWRKLTEILQQF